MMISSFALIIGIAFLNDHTENRVRYECLVRQCILVKSAFDSGYNAGYNKCFKSAYRAMYMFELSPRDMNIYDINMLNQAKLDSAVINTK